MNETPAASAAPAARALELRTRASQIAPLSWPQYRTVRDHLVARGLPLEIASTAALVIADPQEAVERLKSSRLRREILTTGVVGDCLTLDLLVAGLLRAPENLRVEDQRAARKFSLPRYTTNSVGTACILDLREHGTLQEAETFFHAEIRKIDDEIERENRYGPDIAANGIHTGGIVFPLLIGFPGEPWTGGFDTTDCYGRTYFAQTAQGIKYIDVLKALGTVPTTTYELRAHPLHKHRAALLSVAGKVDSGAPLSEAEENLLVRAVMPATKIVLSVQGAPLDEARRRVVAQQHIDRPTEFSADSRWQIRAEAVLNRLHGKGLLATLPGTTGTEVRGWINDPTPTTLPAGIHPDDVVALVAASVMLNPGHPNDKVITAALRSRGVSEQKSSAAPGEDSALDVSGKERTDARSHIAAYLIGRALPLDTARPGLISALERALRGRLLRDLPVDPRPFEKIAADARAEVKESRTGTESGAGPATRHVALRAAFYLTCGAGGSVLLGRSEHGAGKGNANEPAAIIGRLLRTPHGLEQLVQAVFDGRRGFAVRTVDDGRGAFDHSIAPTDEERMTPVALRAIAFSKLPVRTDQSAATQLAEDTDKLRDEAEAVTTRLNTMFGRREDGAPAAIIEERGWKDPRGEIIPGLTAAVKRLESWETIHGIRGLATRLASADREEEQ
ncbi:hypothetical protein [Kitasatospora sp. NPDC088134]|uniref:hypothetical protein n=1 Tax=Kitasatospora sp. NPDC088134 TaxID=3364071 RepID=UPI0038203127